MKKNKKLVSISKASQLLDLSIESVQKLIQKKKLCSVKINGKVFIFEDEILAYKEELCRRKKIEKFIRTFYNIYEPISKHFKMPRKAFTMPLIVSILALYLQFFVSKPQIIIDEIISKSKIIPEDAIVIKNSGLFTANNLKIRITDFYIKFYKGLTILPDENEKAIMKLAKFISGINLSADQRHKFFPCEFFKNFMPIFMKQFVGIETSLLTLEFKYQDFFKFRYKKKIHLLVKGNWANLSWQIIGPKYYKELINKHFKD